MRGAGEPQIPTLAQAQALPSNQVTKKQPPGQNSNGRPTKVLNHWSQYVGGHPVFIARNLDVARRQLLQVLNITGQESLLLPANGTNSLVESVKRSGAKPIFGELDENLALCHQGSFRIAWLQPVLGLPTGRNINAEITVIDHFDSLPRDLSTLNAPSSLVDVAIFGLHLSLESVMEGALLVFYNEALYTRFMANGREMEPSLYLPAGRQLARAKDLSARQKTALEMISRGLQEAAGLPVLPASEGLALAHGVAVQVPLEGSPSNFWSYASGENTPVEWLPELSPLHYSAISKHTSSATNLERWLLVPVGPDNDEVANRQSVLGIVKTAEHLGLRWRTDPPRAANYAALLEDMYGPDHDAYRPVFSTDVSAPGSRLFSPEAMTAPTCKIQTATK